MRLLVLAVVMGGCGGVSPMELHLEQPMALDWRYGVDGVDGVAGVEAQGATRSDWYFMASNDQGGMAPQTFTILVPQGEGTVTLRPWWIILKDDTRGINCNDWSGTATTKIADGTTAVSFDATCSSQSIHCVGLVKKLN